MHSTTYFGSLLSHLQANIPVFRNSITPISLFIKSAIPRFRNNSTEYIFLNTFILTRRWLNKNVNICLNQISINVLTVVFEPMFTGN